RMRAPKSVKLQKQLTRRLLPLSPLKPKRNVKLMRVHKRLPQQRLLKWKHRGARVHQRSTRSVIVSGARWQRNVELPPSTAQVPNVRCVRRHYYDSRLNDCNTSTALLNVSTNIAQYWNN